MRPPEGVLDQLDLAMDGPMGVVGEVFGSALLQGGVGPTQP